MKQTGKTDKRGKSIFYILMFIVFFWFISAQLLGNSEQSSGMSQADYVYQGQILWEKPDGSSEPITIPGKYDVAENETMVLTLQLPETYTSKSEIHWDFIRLALASVADLCIIPLQDYLGLGSEARINTPSTLGNNWRWRMKQGCLTKELADQIRELTTLYGR